MSHRINALNKLNETFDKARIIFGRDFAAPRVTFDLRGRTAGTANYITNHIRFNEILLRENEEKFVNSTIPHEASHLIARAMYGHGIRSHGIEWKGIMGRMGLEPSRCHSYDTTNSVTRTHAKTSMFCSCREHKVTKRVANKVAMGIRYKCRECKVPITSQAPVMSFGARNYLTIG